jgi:uncharacterized protein (TIGR02302 family)
VGSPDQNSERQTARASYAERRYQSRVRNTLVRARLALFWERLWPRLVPPFAGLVLFAIVVFLDLLPTLPFLIHLALLAIFVAAFIAALVLLPRGLRWPTETEARRRIETASALEHRPLETLTETIAVGNDDPAARALWAAHQARAKAALDTIRAGLAAPGLARRDPYAIRFALLIVLVVALVVGAADGDKRLQRAFDPVVDLFKPEPVLVEAWITPPAYTGLPPIVLAAGDKKGARDTTSRQRPPTEPIAVPEGSSLLIQVDGGRTAPTLKLGNDKINLDTTSERVYRAETTIADGKRIDIERGTTRLAGWAINVVPDREPTVAFAEPPGPNEQGQIKLEIEAHDDYGIATLSAFVRLAERGLDDDPLEIQLPLPADSKNVKETSLQDLMSSPWAGLDVSLQLVAHDTADQIGVSDTVTLMLPERAFHNPLAKALVAMRKELVRNPAARRPALAALDILIGGPGQLPDDAVVRLALASAAGQLRYDATRKGTLNVASILWETALRLEDGTLAAAARELAQREKNLLDQLNEKTGDAEIDKLFDQVRDALAKALQEAMKNMADMPPWEGPLPPNTQVMSAQDMFKQLEAAREMAKNGDRDAAKQQLQQMLSMLDALRNGQMGQMSPQQMQQMKQANEMSKQLQDLIRRQKELMDKTFQDSQRGNQRGRNGQQQPGQSGGNQADQQNAIRGDLDELMRQLGEMAGKVPGNLGDAEKSMRDSADALGRGDANGAVDPQQRALQALQQGAGQMSQMMAQAMGLSGMIPMPGGTQAPRAGNGLSTDPFGRPMPATGVANGDEVKIPDASERARAREILDELRKRSSESERPRLELDYIERLLKQF